MSFKGALRTYLLADAAISGLVDDRIYSFPAPQGAAYPYVVFNRIAGFDIQSASSSADIDSDTWQFDVYGSTYATALAVSDAIRARLTVLNNTLFDSYRVHNCRHQMTNDLSELESDGSQDRIVRIQSDFKIKHAINPES